MRYEGKERTVTPADDAGELVVALHGADERPAAVSLATQQAGRLLLGLCKARGSWTH